jgi:hypothetical protein
LIPFSKYILFQQSVEDIPALNLPDVCTMSPERGKAFCRQHCELLQRDAPDVPLGLKDFLKFCGVQAGICVRNIYNTLTWH